jgi:protein-disulfide isomerase
MKSREESVSRKTSTRYVPVAALFAGMLLCTAGLVSAAREQVQSHPKTASIDLRAAKSLGSKSAPITMEIFSDYQCPFCRSFYFDATEQVIKNFVDTGKVYIIYHDFPWDFHAHSMEAARLANAAAEIGKFHEVETVLYSTQDSWETTGRLEDAVASVLSPADLKRVEALRTKPEIQAAIDQDVSLAKQRNVNETPSIFVTYKGQMSQIPAKGASYNFLRQYFDYLLAH